MITMQHLTEMIRLGTQVQLEGIIDTTEPNHRILKLDHDSNRIILVDLSSGLELRLDWEHLDQESSHYDQDQNEACLRIQ